MILSAVKYCKSSLLIFIVLFSLVGNKMYAQDKKSFNLAIQHVRIMKDNSYLNITAKFKGENGFEACKNVPFTVYKIDTTGVVADLKIGVIATNNDGKAKFKIPSQYSLQSASYSVKVENNKIYEDTDESISVKCVKIEATIEKTDSTYTIKAKLLSADNQPIADEALKVGVKRLFGNLGIGDEESYTTDADGAIEVPIDAGLTGTKGMLNFQVVIDESESYGTVIANAYANFGVPIKDESTFNERTMWSPPLKTPIFLLIIPNIILVGIWTILTFLLFNLYKIYKSKN